MMGYDFQILELLKDVPNIPIIINGGARNNDDFKRAIQLGYNAVAATSVFVFFGKKKAVFIQYNSNL
jgi:cyclase